MLLSVPKTQNMCSQKNEFAAFGSKHLPIQKKYFCKCFCFYSQQDFTCAFTKNQMCCIWLKISIDSKTIFQIF